MFFRTSTLLSLALAICIASSASAHGVVTNIAGANGKKGVGFGVSDLSGKKVRLFNQASRYVKGDNSLCGSQKLDGKKQTPINEKSELSKAVRAGLPTADAQGNIKMTLLQVNADGAGPYNCEVSADASGSKFVKMKTVKDVPGTKGKSNAKNAEFDLNIQMPAGTKCSGPGGACLVRCKSALNQPFGGCLAVAQGAAKRDSVTRVVQEARFHREAIDARELDSFDLEEEDPEDVDTDEVVLNP